MKFIDEANIRVIAGNGGDGYCSFLREKFRPFGGPDGGDGGDGGSIYLIGDTSVNTLVEFQFQRQFKAESGDKGGTNNCRGKKGKDLYIKVPLGTIVQDIDTQEILGDITQHGQLFKVAQGGFHGLGNTRFKSSINRAPYKFTPGSSGEERSLHLELKLLADVGLLGFPNAGKSSLIRAVSAAKPKVADYPFTTLEPHLGVVRIDAEHSFVIADIPGIIEGASEGTGLGLQFLRHIARTKLLLHLVDLAPYDGSDPFKTVRAIEKELKKFDPELIKKPRWLVFNKIDLLDEAELGKRIKALIKRLKWPGPVFQISALQKIGTQELMYKIASFFSSQHEAR